MAQKTIWIILLSFSTLANGFVPQEIKDTLTNSRLQTIITDRNKDDIDDIKFSGNSIFYDNDYNNIFETKISFYPDHKIIYQDSNQDYVYEYKKVFHYQGQQYSIYKLESDHYELEKQYIPLFENHLTFTNKFKLISYKNQKQIDEKIYTSEYLTFNLLGWFLIREANPLPNYGPNHFVSQFEQCNQLIKIFV